jgi:hypothetical protein
MTRFCHGADGVGNFQERCARAQIAKSQSIVEWAKWSAPLVLRGHRAWTILPTRRALPARCPLYAFFPSFDHFIGERQGNERFDAQNKFKLVSLFDSSHLRHSGL